MEQELISKKDLLERYGISYGALYRWKRKGLIPEDWFIKKSTVTGQETFFPKSLICERVELIIREKEEICLDELLKQFNKETSTRPSVTVKTALGTKKFYLSEIVSVVLDKGEEKQDITKKILKILEE